MRANNNKGGKLRKAMVINAATIQKLESRTLFSNNLIPTALEVYAVELINRARADPPAEVTRLASNPSWGGTPDLNEGLMAGTISAAAKPPLAINTILTYTSRSHSQYEISNNTFGHNEGTVDPFTRMTNAGYNWQSAGENIASEGTTGTLDNMTATTDEQNALFIDGSEPGRGHRLNLMDEGFNEVGAGIATGVEGGFNTLNLTQDFGNTGGGSFLTGITYHDTSGDNFFEPGEEDGGVTITATRTSDSAVFTTTSWASGGYSLPLAAGTYHVVASGGNIGSPAAQTVTISGNVEADFLQGTTSPPPTLTLPSGTYNASVSNNVLSIATGGAITNYPLTGVTQINVSQSSKVTLTGDLGSTNPGTITLNVSAGNSVIAKNTQHLNNLIVAGTLTVVAGGTGPSVISTNGLTLNGGIDLNNNDIIVHNTGSVTPAQELTYLTALLRTGYNGGTWSGLGIASTSAATNTAHLTAAGVMPVTTSGTFEGQSVTTTDVIVKYTYYGDANLDGKVDGSDYSRVDSGFLTHATGWFNGDFNYDGAINGSDYTLIDNAFNTQGVTITSSIFTAPAGTIANLGGRFSSKSVTLAVAASSYASTANSNDWFTGKQKKPKHSFFE